MPEFNAPPTAVPPSWMNVIERQRDLDHLRVLAVLHYVFGGLTMLGSCCGLLYVVLGIGMAADPSAFDDGRGGPPPPPFVGGMLAVTGGCLIVVLSVMGGLIIYAGRCLATQRCRIFGMVMAALMCLSVPLGTLLGVFTLIVLARASVAAIYEERRLATIAE